MQSVTGHKLSGWLTTLALLGCLAVSSRAEDPRPVVNTIKLDLAISGLGAEGCKVEIKPAHPACKFPAVTKTFETTPSSGILRLEPLTFTASSVNADRDCAFAITITEPSGKPITYKRSLRLQVPSEGDPTPELTHSIVLRNAVVASKERPTRKP